MSGSVQNTISPDLTGYIRKERLEARLLSLFGKPIKVRVRTFADSAGVSTLLTYKVHLKAYQ